MWKARLDGLSFPLETWLRNEDRGNYWRHGSVIHQLDQMRAPILCVGGWSDRYSNSVMSLVDRRPDLAWGLLVLGGITILIMLTWSGGRLSETYVGMVAALAD